MGFKNNNLIRSLRENQWSEISKCIEDAAIKGLEEGRGWNSISNGVNVHIALRTN